jgi:uncharacterized protein (TIGR02186 family)
MFSRARTPIVVGIAFAAFFVHTAGVAGIAAGIDPAGSFRVDPSRITVGNFFHGTTLRVSGPLEAGSDVVVVVTAGQTVQETYNRKGRIGPFWATVGKVTIGEVPALHLIASGAPVAKLLSRSEIDANLMDLDALVHRAALKPAGSDRDVVVAEYLKLKQRQGVVGLFESAIQLRGTSGDASFDAAIPWPAAAPEGTYRVIVRQVRDGKVVGEAAQSLEVAYVGLPRLIAHLAFDRSLEYGVLAVIIALGVGLVMGLLFKKGAAGH